MTAVAMKRSPTTDSADRAVLIPRRLHPFAPDAAFAVVVVSAVAWRLHALEATGGVSGMDWADMLWMGHAYLGHRVGSASITYPPLVPLLSTAAAAIFGVVRGFALLGAIGSVLPALGVYMALRTLKAPWRVGLVCVLLVIASSSSEQAAWGGLPELLGFGLLPGLLVALAKAAELPSRGRLITFGSCLFLLAATSHLVLAEAAEAVVALAVLTVIAGDATVRRATVRSSGPIILSALPTLVFVPLYLHLASTLTLGAAIQRSGAMPLLAKFDYVFREDRAFWMVVLVAALAALALAISGRSPGAVFRASAALTVSTAAAALGLADVRFFYLVPLAATMGAAASFSALPARRGSSGFIAAACVLSVLVVANLSIAARNAVALLPRQVAFYTALSAPRPVIAAAEWIKTHLSPSATVAVSSVSGSPVGWWVDGLAERTTLTEANVQFLYFPAQRKQSVEAAAIFAQPFPNRTSFAMARRDHVTYLLVLRPSAGVRAFARSHPALSVFSDGDAVILATGLAP